MGEIIQIGSGDGTYNYELPIVPREIDILYHDLPKNEQYWGTSADKFSQHRIKAVKKMNEKERISYINLWRSRWLNGMWFMNNGQPTYITGAHVEHLCMNKFDNQFLYYLDSQRERFYFRDLTNKDRKCDGRVWIKARRTGITTEQRTEAIRTVLNGFSYKVGMQSTKLEVCQRTLMKPIIDTYINRYSWLRESFYKSNGRKPVKALSLTNSVLNEEEETLGGFVMPFPTAPSALDGDGWMLIIMDELSKWVECGAYETLEINLKAIVNPGKRGKIDCLSTTGDSQEAAKAVSDWHKLIANSNPKIRNANGKTNSGLYKFFVSGIHSLDLIEEVPQLLDKYGYINKEMAEEYLWNNINKYSKDSKEYVFALYKTPMEERHAMLSSSTLNIFPKIRISARLEELALLSIENKPYVRGRLEEGQDGKVTFVEDIEGLWLWAVHPYFSFENNIDTRNRFLVRNGVIFPARNFSGAIGYDPVNYPKENIKTNSFSQAAIVVKQKFDYFGQDLDNVFMGAFIGRLDDPHDINKEVMKACKYTGFPCMHERSVAHVYEDFRDSNMLPMLMKGEDGHYGLPPNQKTTKDGVAILQSEYAAPKTPEQKDMIACYPFEDGLLSLDSFDPSNTTPYDFTMAEIYCGHGLKQVIYTNLTDKTANENLKWIQEFIPKR